jgi:hypothetical protein
MAIRTDDPVGVVVDALIAAAGTLPLPAPPALPIAVRPITVAATAATAGSFTHLFMNA